MSNLAATILESLHAVDSERTLRASAVGLARKVDAIKTYQQRRFAHTYADLLASQRYAPAARFFLDEMYGPGDFTRRDAQFARVVPALVRLFPREVVEAVAAVAELHALSERLDTIMGLRSGDDVDVSGIGYAQNWQRTGHARERERQIDLTLEVATRLDRFTRKPLIRNSLRLMRGPARAAGMTELQQFLERGFDAFRSMRGAQEFMHIVESRERALATDLFETQLAAGNRNEQIDRLLARLP